MRAAPKPRSLFACATRRLHPAPSTELERVMNKIEGIVAEQFREMELGDWSAVRGGNTFEANSSTANNYSCDEDGDWMGSDSLVDLMIYVDWLKQTYGY
jgi:hypothetical protein